MLSHAENVMDLTTAEEDSRYRRHNERATSMFIPRVVQLHADEEETVMPGEVQRVYIA